MTQHDNDAASPAQWIARARSNLIRARGPRPKEVFWEDLCYDAQQAAEKALKAALLHKEKTFRYTHDLGELWSELSSAGVTLPAFAQNSVSLSQYAIGARYPGTYEPVTEAEYRDTLQFAEMIVDWAEEVIGAWPGS